MKSIKVSIVTKSSGKRKILLELSLSSAQQLVDAEGNIPERIARNIQEAVGAVDSMKRRESDE